jgi:hypothetical protein
MWYRAWVTPSVGHWVAASSINGLLAYARGLGIATDSVLASLGIAQAALDGAHARVPESVCNQVWDAVVAASQDDDFGLHFAERTSL